MRILEELSNAHGSAAAVKIAEKELRKYAEVSHLGDSLVATIKGESDYTILLDAHIDEVGFIVTSISEKGFVKVAKMGGIDPRILPASEVVIHGKEDITGVFATLPPHLKKEDSVTEIADMVIDTGLENAVEMISPGDRVTYKMTAKTLQNGRITGKSLDDRAGVYTLLRVAQELSLKPPVSVKILLSDQEELGHLGAITSAHTIEPNEAVAVDVTFADGPDIPAEKCGTMGEGAMIGVSPTLSEKITEKLQKIAKNGEIKHQLEIMGGKTSTNADVITLTKSGIPCGLVSIPIRNMHTPAETCDMADIEAVASILAEYIMKGGIK